MVRNGHLGSGKYFKVVLKVRSNAAMCDKITKNIIFVLTSGIQQKYDFGLKPRKI